MSYWQPQQPPPSAYPNYQHVQYSAPVKTEPAATLSIAFALSSFVIPVIPAIVAIFLAQAAKRSVNSAEGALKGRGLANTAVIIAIASLLLTVLVALIVALV